jgi:hypothetical protein
VTYSAPMLTLVGTASNVVLVKQVLPVFDNAIDAPRYDSTAFVEAEW